MEFDAWYRQKRRRDVLGGLSGGVLAVLVMLTLTVCLLLSGAVTESETLLWTEDVDKSIVMQIFVADPAVSLVVVLLKLTLSWILRQVGKRRARKQQQVRSESMGRQEEATLDEVVVMDATTKSLEVVAHGDIEAVMAEKDVQENAKSECEVTLRTIAIAKVSLSDLRRAVKPRKMQLEQWDAEDVELEAKEQKTRRTLGAIEAALKVLKSEHVDAEEKLREAQEALAKLKKRLARIASAKAAMERAKLAVQDAPPKLPPVKKGAIMPISVRAERRGEVVVEVGEHVVAEGDADEVVGVGAEGADGVVDEESVGGSGKVDLSKEEGEPDVDRLVLSPVEQPTAAPKVPIFVRKGFAVKRRRRRGARAMKVAQQAVSRGKQVVQARSEEGRDGDNGGGGSDSDNAGGSRLSARLTWAQFRRLRLN